ncbi:hypothetical protein ACFXOD_11700 [Streptomyces sp. NPDC059161]|uniref:hypothetical protein n=1 Tax=Streptomyces sp. NPDC059161 TaxID=3346749 RepID=UPI00368DAF55
MAMESNTIDPCAATERLRDALTRAGIVFPSLGTDYGSSLGLVNLGRVHPDVAVRLALRLDKGHDA